MASMRLQPGIGETLGTEDRHVAGRPLSPWLTLQSAATHLGYDGDPRKDADAVRQLAKRHQLPLYRRGRRLLISRIDLDKWLRAQRVAG